MTEIEIQEEVINLTESKLPNQEQLHSLTVCLIEMEEDMFEKILSSNILKIGFERTMLEVIFPFLKKIGILWQTGAINASQEHFISNLVRKKIFVATDGLYVSPDSGSKKYALFLPEGETHEMSILFANYMLRARKIRTTYLGQSIPLEDMEAYYHTHRPDYLVTSFISSPGPSEVQKYINTLGKTFPDSTILLSGYQAIWNDLKFPKNVRLLKSFKEFIHFVEKEPFSG
ncbi:MAG: cobalamin B12-binding domain-containing protein [Cyclobacteriaceae bacterium]|nr:cobalamin B12-binding domain-containing protein [Cyclobacteriaceae bacterium]